MVLPVIALTVMSFQQPVEQVLSETAITQVEGAALYALAGDPDIPSRFPLDMQYRNNVTIEFGWEGLNPITKEKMKHKGIDLRAPKGTAVYATANGVVAKSSYHEGYGKMIVIKHEQAFATLYAHLDELLVEEGEELKIGQKIGTVGSTGRSTGPHLHYEVRKGGEHLDPADYF